MDEVSESGYMFSYTYSLDSDKIYRLIDDEIKKLDPKYHRYNLKINVVKNKSSYCTW